MENICQRQSLTPRKQHLVLQSRCDKSVRRSMREGFPAHVLTESGLLIPKQDAARTKYSHRRAKDHKARCD